VEILYNGLKLPEKWPPDYISIESLSEPHPLIEPPQIINADIGKQLFVDDFLVEETGLKRTFHKPELFSSNPVVFPDRSWEQIDNFSKIQSPTAMVFSDGVWYDPKDKLFKMWYMGGCFESTCYAVSQDGIKWEKPSLDIVEGTNIVHTVQRDSSTVWLDLEEIDERKRYKFFVFEHPKAFGNLSVYFSGDGIHWGEKILETGRCGDRTTVFYNPFRKKWVYSLRDFIKDGPGRIRRYYETDDIINNSNWKDLSEVCVWIGSDRLDLIREDLKIPCQLYNLDCAGYESILLGLFSIWRGHPDYRQKINEICTGFSRDGFHWYRPDRTPFIGVSERCGDWNWSNVQSAGGCCLVVNDKLYFYFSGRAGIKGSSQSGISSTGLAILRRDGFASMDAEDKEETLTTRKIIFSKRHLFVNVSTEKGYLLAEILDENNNPVEPFSKERCVPVSCNSTSTPVKWQNVENLSTVAGKPVRIRFYLKNGSLYSFWFSKDNCGKSDGFVAAGGPGFETNRDI